MELNFNEVTYNNWLDQLAKENKGQLPEKILNQLVEKNIAFSALNNSQTFSENIQTPNFQNKPWFFAESIHSNSQLQAALSWGINFLQINNSNNIAKLLHGLFPEMVTTSIDATQHLLETLNFIKQNKKGNFIVFLDPLNHALNKGLSKNNFNELKITYQQNFTKMVSNSPEVVGIAANAITIQLAGGNINHQLKTILHTLSTYLYWISEINLIQSIKNVQVHVAVSTNYFVEIAKIRSLKILIANLLENYNVPNKVNINVLAQTSTYNYTRNDYYNNILRATTQTMSAITGGATAIEVLPFTIKENLHSNFSWRIARNIHHILCEEAMLNKVFDIPNGSYFIEKLTYDITNEVWKSFSETDTQLNYPEYLATGALHQEVLKNHEDYVKQLHNGQKVMVGVNKYQNKTDKPLEPTTVQNTNTPNQNWAISPLPENRLAEEFEQKLN